MKTGQTLQPNPISHKRTHFSICLHAHSLLLGAKVHVCTHWELRGALDRVSGAYSLSAVRWMIFLLWSLILSASFSLVCLERSRGTDNGLQWGSCELLSQSTMMLNDNDIAIITLDAKVLMHHRHVLYYKFIYWFLHCNMWYNLWHVMQKEARFDVT